MVLCDSVRVKKRSNGYTTSTEMWSLSQNSLSMFRTYPVALLYGLVHPLIWKCDSYIFIWVSTSFTLEMWFVTLLYRLVHPLLWKYDSLHCYIIMLISTSFNLRVWLYHCYNGLYIPYFEKKLVNLQLTGLWINKCCTLWVWLVTIVIQVSTSFTLEMWSVTSLYGLTHSVFCECDSFHYDTGLYILYSQVTLGMWIITLKYRLVHLHWNLCKIVSKFHKCKQFE